MIKVVGVRFKEAGKVYYFDPAGLELKRDDELIVETARGLEFGYAACDVKEVADEEVVQPLKPVLRVATDEDRKVRDENIAKKGKALAICEEKIAKRGLEMKLVDVEYTFDNSKLIFYFTADGRVDFRELVKDLASVFHMRIELRQIGVRDEMKLMGGIGACGRELCCASWMGDFAPVSIKMAKTQNLSLNPIKISGTCGRLMCCLQFENQVYSELRKGMPDVGEHIDTRDGEAVVMDVNILLNKIKARLVLEKKTDEKPEKLSTEYYTYEKEEIRRREKPKNNSQPKQGEKKAHKHGKKRNLEDVDFSQLTEEDLMEAEE